MNIKRTDKRILIGLVIFLFLSNFITIGLMLYLAPKCQIAPTSYEVPPKNHKTYHRELLKRFKTELQLDSLQSVQFEHYHAQFRHTADSLIGQMKIKHEAYKTLMFVDTIDVVKLEELAHEFGNLHAQMKNATLVLYLNMRDHCKPAQVKTLNSLIDKMTGKRHFKCEKDKK